jgi:hypothetical protein
VALRSLQEPGVSLEIAARTSDPDPTLRNLLERDHLFTLRLAAQTQRLGLRALHIGIDTPGTQVNDRVEAAFVLAEYRPQATNGGPSQS